MAQQKTPVEIVPGIYQIKLPLVDNPAGHINTYLIKGNDEWVMIDTGWNDPQALEELIHKLSELALGLEDISRIIYTHIHPDHFGLAGTLKQKYGTELIVHNEGEKLIDYRYYGREAYIKELGDWHLINGGTSQNADAVIEMSTSYTDRVAPVFPDILLHGGESIVIDPFRFEVIWTPGHDNDHICLYEKEKGILFSGDHILPDTITHIGMHTEITFNPHFSYMQSLQAMRHIQVSTILPGHERTFCDLPQRIDELLSYHTKLKEDVFETIRHEPKTAYQISSEIKWVEGPMKWEVLAAVTQAGLVTKTLAYLEALRAEKKVEKVDKNGLTIYNAT